MRDRLRELRVFESDLPEFGREAEDPMELFVEWLSHAIDAGVPGPQAMTLSTVDPYGRPDSRVLLLKDVAGGRLQFATSRTSRKGRHVATAPMVAATFWWRELARQIRVRGRVAEGTREEAAADFLARPEDSRAESLIGHQSELLTDPDALASAFADARERIAAEPDLVPDHWAVYHLVPEEVEFWQGSANRLHTRLRYERGATGGWRRSRRWP